MSISDEDVRKIISPLKLDELEEELLQSHLRKCKVHKTIIRDVLCHEGIHNKKAYFLLEGRVNLLATLKNGDKVVISQINAKELLNIEIALNGWRNQYTITVASTFIRYIVIQDKDVTVISHQLKRELSEITKFRENERQKKEKRAELDEKTKKMDEQIKKLKLPDINYREFKRNPSLMYSQNKVQSSELRKEEPQSSINKSQRSSISKGVSLKNLRNSNLYSENIQQHNMKQVQEKLLDHYHEYQDKVAQKKLQRLKSQRSLSLNEHIPQEKDLHRNERLFKQQLKNIVKRKLIFQRRHFKILKKLNNKEHELQYDSKRKAHPRYEDQDCNPIDNYFDI